MRKLLLLDTGTALEVLTICGNARTGSNQRLPHVTIIVGVIHNEAWSIRIHVDGDRILYLLCRYETMLRLSIIAILDLTNSVKQSLLSLKGRLLEQVWSKVCLIVLFSLRRIVVSIIILLIFLRTHTLSINLVVHCHIRIYLIQKIRIKFELKSVFYFSLIGLLHMLLVILSGLFP